MAIYVVAAELGLQKHFSSLLLKNLVRNPELSDHLPATTCEREITIKKRKIRESGGVEHSQEHFIRLCSLPCIIVNAIYLWSSGLPGSQRGISKTLDQSVRWIDGSVSQSEK